MTYDAFQFTAVKSEWFSWVREIFPAVAFILQHKDAELLSKAIMAELEAAFGVCYLYAFAEIM